MTADKVREVIALYRATLDARDIAPVAITDGKSWNMRRVADELHHARWMCDEVERMLVPDDPDPEGGFKTSDERAELDAIVVAGRIEKAMRWLGFIQGVLWTTGIYSIDDMKDHNRP